VHFFINVEGKLLHVQNILFTTKIHITLPKNVN